MTEVCGGPDPDEDYEENIWHEPDERFRYRPRLPPADPDALTEWLLS